MPDGRRLAYTEWGLPDGKPVLYFHGSPGSRLWCPDEKATSAARVRLIMPDRPGIGRSDPLEGRTLADWPNDVEVLADALQMSSFAVVGVSAGGPYAAACAALIPGRLSGVAIVSSVALAKYNWAERPNAEEEWSTEQRAEFDLAQKDPAAAAQLAAEHFADEVNRLEEHPELIHKELEAAEGDRWFFEDASRTAIFDAHIRETWRQGLDAIKWELIDVFLPWGFRLADISIPVNIWHGSQDPWVKQEHIDFQASTIPKCSLVTWPDSGHLGFVKHWNDILEAVV
jgi:Predicted hydrolases or acyltransferases (alpha/beta hydrolase superfamily)